MASTKKLHPDWFVLGRSTVYVDATGVCLNESVNYIRVTSYLAKSYDCGKGKLTAVDVYSWGRAGALSDAQIGDVLVDPCGFGFDLAKPPLPKPLLGDWRIKPVAANGQWYARNVMKVVATGAGRLSAVDADACKWQVGNPVYRNLTGSGNTYTGERYRGPCVPEAQAWTPVSVTVAPDGKSITENITGYPTPLTWFRTDVSLDCGTQGSLAWDSLRGIYDEATTSLSLEDQNAFFGDTCSALNVDITAGETSVVDDGTDPTVMVAAAKSAGSNGAKAAAAAAPCKKATSPVQLIARLNAARYAVLATYNMATRFCYDGKKVWKPAKKGFAPEATVENHKITGFGLAYQVTFLGATTGSSGFLADDQKFAETTITTNWTGGLPLIKWVWPENDSVTATQRVGSAGTVVTRMSS